MYLIFVEAYITMLLHGQSDGVWIGLKDGDTMKWTNGKPVTYTNWSPVEPEHSVSVDMLKSPNEFCRDLCLMMHVVWLYCVHLQQEEWLSDGIESLCTVLSNTHNFHFTGKWYKDKCTNRGYGFVCQKTQGGCFFFVSVLLTDMTA